jgi:glycosyltransferase involved in cell wall biosynthesis
MGYGNCVLTLATPENIEAVGDAGIPYADELDLAEKLQRVLRDGSLVQSFRHRAQLRVQRHYDWNRVVDQYEKLFADMAGTSRPTDDGSSVSDASQHHDKILMVSKN